MSQKVEPTRIRRPSWRDPRLGVGILLVAASVALGSWVFAQAGQTVEVYAAREVLVPGQSIEPEDLQVVAVQISPVAQTYVTSDHTLAEDAVAVRTVGAGELLPSAAVGSAAQVDLRPVTIPTSATAAAAVERGAVVDVWVARPDEDGGPGARLAPEQLLSGVHVSELLEDSSLFAGADQMHVQVLVAGADLGAVLEALSVNAEVFLVPGPGG